MPTTTGKHKAGMLRRDTLNLRISATARNLFDQAAQSSGKTRTDVILEAAL